MNKTRINRVSANKNQFNKSWLNFSVGSTLAAVLSLLLSLWLSGRLDAEDELKTKRFISKDNPPKVSMEHFALDDVSILGHIEGSYKKNKYLTTNDKIYLRMKNSSASVGDRFSIIQEQGAIKEGKSKIGTKINLKGFVEVTEVLPTAIVGRIYDAKIDIHLGDHIAPEFQTFLQVDPQEPAADLRGKVIGETNSRPLIGAYDFVYINKGEADGLRLNDSLDVIRTVDGNEALKAGLPEIAFAKLVVVQVASRTAVAYTIASADKFEAGATFKSTKSEIRYLPENALGASEKSPTPQ